MSCWASVLEIRDNLREVPLGTALGETELQVLAECGTEIGEGEGELCIGSSTRICYIDNNELNSSYMMRKTGDIVRKTKDGSIIYVGRKNCVFKRFGVKINSEVIESVIQKETNLYNAAVWIEESKQLAVFIALEESSENVQKRIIDKLRVKLLHSLKKECFPDHIQIVAKLPVTHNGKIDKKALEQLIIFKTSESATDIEKLFKSLWVTYLGIGMSECYENCTFLELGGNSISAIQLLRQFEECTGCDSSSDLTMLIFQNTFSECCDFVRKLKRGESKKRSLEIIEGVPKKTMSGQKRVTLDVRWKVDLKGCIDSSPAVFNRQ